MNQITNYLVECYAKSQERQNAPSGCDLEDWKKTYPVDSSDDLNRGREGGAIPTKDMIDNAKLLSNKEIFNFICRWMKCGMQSPLLDEVKRWFSVLKNKSDEFINEENCTPIGEQFRSMDSQAILDNFLEPKATTKQCGSMDGFENEWRSVFNYTDDVDEFTIHLSAKNSEPMMFIGNDDARWTVLEKLGAKYSFEKHPDVLISANGWLIIGERKTIADQGGAQTAQVKDAIRFPGITDLTNGTIGLAIMIGTYWDKYDRHIPTKNKNGTFRKQRDGIRFGCPGVIHTALLVEFVKQLPRYEGNRWENV